MQQQHLIFAFYCFNHSSFESLGVKKQQNTVCIETFSFIQRKILQGDHFSMYDLTSLIIILRIQVGASITFNFSSHV